MININVPFQFVFAERQLIMLYGIWKGIPLVCQQKLVIALTCQEYKLVVLGVATFGFEAV